MLLQQSKTTFRFRVFSTTVNLSAALLFNYFLYEMNGYNFYQILNSNMYT